MSWKCNSCGKKVSGDEEFCPECSMKIVYKCKECGKVMDNGKFKYCPICNTAKAETKKKAIKIVTTVLGAVAVFASVLAGGNSSGDSMGGSTDDTSGGNNSQV